MFFRLQLPLVFAFVVGFLTVFTYFFTERAVVLKGAVGGIEQYMIIVAGFALLLGVVNVFQSNVRKIERRESGWPFALTLLLGLVVMGLFGVLGAARVGGPFEGITELPNGSPTPFQWMTTVFFTPLQATMFSLLAFYIASAAFRAFRVRNVEATILLSAAMVVMLGRIPFGEYLFSFVHGGTTWLPRFTEWLMQNPNSAAQRGIMIGAALGAASLSLRVILGVERSYLGLEK
jgi:hypothetical protein